MTKITFLGTASAVPDRNHCNTHFIVQSGRRNFLIDCSGNPIVRLEQAAIDPLAITDIVLTHFHPDHVSGFPLLLMDLWLLGRTEPLIIYGLGDVIDRVEQMMALYEWDTWTGLYPVRFHNISDTDLTASFEVDGIKITTALVSHLIPGIGIRLTFPDGVLCYSSDTAPCEAVVKLASGADILIHEASGAGKGHSSAEQAGSMAEKSGTKRLYLVHYPPSSDLAQMVSQAKSTFSGEVCAAEDLMTVSL